MARSHAATLTVALGAVGMVLYVRHRRAVNWWFVALTQALLRRPVVELEADYEAMRSRGFVDFIDEEFDWYPGDVDAGWRATTPVGWYGLCASRKVRRGDTRTIVAFGKRLMVVRGPDDAVAVLDPVCPHLGANLGVFTTLRNGVIQCPFHEWKFSPKDGRCMGTCTSEKSPGRGANLRRYVSREVNDYIHVWWDPATPLDEQQAAWELDVEPSDGLRLWGLSTASVACSPEEVSQNGADVLHLSVVHGPGINAGADIDKINHQNKWVWHEWCGEWEPQGYFGHLKLKQELYIAGRRLNLATMNVHVTQFGPAIAQLNFDTPLGGGRLSQYVLPLGRKATADADGRYGPRRQHVKVVHELRVDARLPSPIAGAVLAAEVLQLRRDAVIWNSKRQLRRPCLTAGTHDRLLARHTAWYNQFRPHFHRGGLPTPRSLSPGSGQETFQ